MESHNTLAFKVSTLAAAVVAAYAVPVAAEDGGIAEFITPRSSLSVGASYQNKDRDQLGTFDGRRKDGSKAFLDADIVRRDDASGTWNTLKMENLGLDTAEFSITHGRQSDYGLSFEYNRIPRETQFTVNSGLQGLGQDQRVVSINPGTGSNLELGIHRDRYGVALNKWLGETVELSAKFRHEKKQGLRPFGAYSGAQANFLVEPINSTTRLLDVTLNYQGKDLQLQGGYFGSWYDNANSQINMITSTAARVYISLPPDNQAHQLFVNGSYAISPATKMTMRLARAVGTQNDQSLLSALPASLVWNGYSGIKARVVTTEGQFGISSRVTKDLSLLANVNLHNRKDKTLHAPYNNQGTPDETTPHSFKTLNAKFEATYRVRPGFKLMGGAYLEARERSIPFENLNNAPAAPTNAGANWTVNAVGTNEREVPYRSRNKERTLKGQATNSFTDELNASLALARSKRDGTPFKWTDQINLVNPLHMANRDRDKVGVKLDWSPSEIVSLQAQIDHAKDEYGLNGLWGNYTAANGSQLLGTGIKDGSARLFSLDTTVKMGDSWQLTAWYSRDESKAMQYAYQANFGRDPIRKTNLADIGDSLGIGLQGKATAKLTLGADLQWNKSVGKFEQVNFTNQANMIEDLPSITSKTLRLALNGAYRLDKNSSLRIDLIHDRWETNDWTWSMWNNRLTELVPFAFSADGTSVTTRNKQSANLVAVRYKYEF